MFIVMDGQEGKPFDHVGEPFYSPDSRHIAYWASMDGGWYIVVDAKMSENRFDGSVKKSPLVFDSESTLHGIAWRLPGPEFFRIDIEITN